MKRLLTHIALSVALVLVATPAFQAAVPSSTPPVVTIILAVLGQSNAEGTGTVTAEDLATHARVFAYYNSYRPEFWPANYPLPVLADRHKAPGGTWGLAVDPIHVKPSSGVGPALTAAKAIANARPDDTIGIIPCAVGSTLLSQWERGSTYYDPCVARIKQVLQQMADPTRGPPAVWAIWHHGEDDSKLQSTADTYQTRVVRMFGDLRADLSRPNLPIVVGDMAQTLSLGTYPYQGTVRAALANIPYLVPHTQWVSSVGASSGGTHFNTTGYHTMGQRDADALLVLAQ